MGRTVKWINIPLLLEMADIRSVVESLGLPAEEYRGTTKVLNVFRDDKSLGSCYFREGRLTDWADHSYDGKNIIHYVRKVTGEGFRDACELIAKASGFGIGSVMYDADTDDLDAAEKQKADIRRLQKKNERIAALLGLDGQQEVRPAYRHSPCWMDEPVIAVISDDYYVNVHSKSKGDFLMDPGKAAKKAAGKRRGKAQLIDEFELSLAPYEYDDPALIERHRRYQNAIDNGYPYRRFWAISEKKWAPTLTELQVEDEEAYNFLIAGKKREKLQELAEEEEWAEENIPDEKEYQETVSTIQKIREEVMAI